MKTFQEYLNEATEKKPFKSIKGGKSFSANWQNMQGTVGVKKIKYFGKNIDVPEWAKAIAIENSSYGWDVLVFENVPKYNSKHEMSNYEYSASEKSYWSGGGKSKVVANAIDPSIDGNDDVLPLKQSLIKL